MQNVLYISYDGMTDSLGQSQVLPYIVGLSKDYQFHLISFEKPERYEKNKNVIQQICDENNIVWHPLMYNKRPPVLSTVYDVFKLFRLAKKLDQQHDFKILHCRSYISALLGLSFKKKRNKKFIFDMRGFWADERVDGGIWNLKNPLFKMVYSYFKRKEREFLIHSDAIVSLTENGKQEILSWNLSNVNSDKITVIPCCVNLDLFDSKSVESIDKSALRKEIGLSDSDFVLGYVGSIGTWYMLSEMLDFFKTLSSIKENVKFFFLTAEDSEKIYRLANEKGIVSSQLKLHRCLHHEVPKYISIFDFSIFFILPVYSKKASSPTKQGELMAMGIPVICNSGVGDTDEIVHSSESGIVIEQLNQESYMRAIQKMDELQLNQQELPHATERIFGLKNGVQRYLSIYQNCSE